MRAAPRTPRTHNAPTIASAFGRLLNVTLSIASH
jgi:hypothetical protein